jgi:hypothetical protein
MCKKQQQAAAPAQDNNMNMMLMMMLMQMQQRMGDMENVLGRVVSGLEGRGAWTPGMQDYLQNICGQIPGVNPSFAGLPAPQGPATLPAPGQVAQVPGVNTLPAATQPGFGFGLNQTWRVYPV